jgi:hypothetical protein
MCLAKILKATIPNPVTILISHQAEIVGLPAAIFSMDFIEHSDLMQ